MRRMLFIWIFVLLWAGSLRAQVPVRCRGPLSEEQLADLIRSHVPEARIELFVRTCDVSFAVDPASLARLRKGGASPALLDLLAKKRKEPRALDTWAGLKFEFVRIPAGEFQMGSENRDADEKPAHHVRITKAFEMGRYEVTQAVWEKVIGSNPSHFKGPDRPVEAVSWNAIQEFLGKLNAMNDGYRYRLPTEAEWEYAARAGSAGDSDDLDSTAWYDGNSGGTHPVGTKRPNAWGLYDMLGNVREWCQDWYDENYYRNSLETDPPGPGSGQTRVVRGGSWFDSSRNVRAAYRFTFEPGTRPSSIGFRLVRERSQ